MRVVRVVVAVVGLGETAGGLWWTENDENDMIVKMIVLLMVVVR